MEDDVLQLPQSRELIIYCACSPDEEPGQTDSGTVAIQLINRFGYNKIRLLEGGWIRWQKMGYPTEKGDK